eukprot:TRINITY_DN1708_c0_g1_i1.p2 TRINITY_DN1708_c0_g1~~TRINITY_DN1708_c0_g1_i1.p2  ORF type:complete len:145 (-),score=20.27 TRINITY_DN1708_c0_g1_i1:494-928(-)
MGNAPYGMDCCNSNDKHVSEGVEVHQIGQPQPDTRPPAPSMAGGMYMDCCYSNDKHVSEGVEVHEMDLDQPGPRAPDRERRRRRSSLTDGQNRPLAQEALAIHTAQQAPQHPDRAVSGKRGNREQLTQEEEKRPRERCRDKHSA